MARSKQNVKKTLLCATRFWSVDHTISGQWQTPGKGTTPTLRAGVRHVVRKQGFSSTEIDKAERQLVNDGLLVRGGAGTGASLALTAKASKVSCSTVKLAPWTDAQYTGASLAGARRRRTSLGNALEVGHLQRPGGRVEMVAIKHEHGDRWLAHHDGRWRRVHIQVNGLHIKSGKKRIPIVIDGV